MSLLSSLFRAVHSWRSGPGARKAGRRAGLSVEHLDHRQLLSVNFTGNVPTDFPATKSPGVVVLNDPNNQQPIIPANLASAVNVSGFDISAIRVSYTPSDDTLSIGLDQPPARPGSATEVISGDADNNGVDGGPTSAAVLNALAGTGIVFKDFPTFGGSESMGAFLDLKGSGYADVVAGYAVNDPNSPKQYQVAQAVVNTTGPPTTPQFGQALPAFVGTVFKGNTPASPNLEFSIAHFSQLYLEEVGKPLTPDATIGVGGFGGSGDDAGITEEFFHEQPVLIANASPPVVPARVLINPHSASHINTVHSTEIRVSVLGSPALDVTQIEPNTVTFGGAHPIFSFERFVNRDKYLDETFVFRGPDVVLSSGRSQATVSGQLTTGGSFTGTHTVFNRDASFYSPAAVAGARARQAARAARTAGETVIPSSVVNRAASRGLTIQTAQGRTTAAPSSTTAAPAVTLSTKNVGRPRLSPRLQSSIGAVATTTVADSSHTSTVRAGSKTKAPVKLNSSKDLTSRLETSLSKFLANLVPTKTASKTHSHSTSPRSVPVATRVVKVNHSTPAASPGPNLAT